MFQKLGLLFVKKVVFLGDTITDYFNLLKWIILMSQEVPF